MIAKNARVKLHAQGFSFFGKTVCYRFVAIQIIIRGTFLEVESSSRVKHHLLSIATCPVHTKLKGQCIKRLQPLHTHERDVQSYFEQYSKSKGCSQNEEEEVKNIPTYLIIAPE